MQSFIAIKQSKLLIILKPINQSPVAQKGNTKSNNKPAIHIGLCVDDKRALIGSNVATLIMQVNRLYMRIQYKAGIGGYQSRRPMAASDT